MEKNQKMFSVVNNFLDNEILHKIKTICVSEFFPWYVVKEKPYQLSHIIVKNHEGKIEVTSDFFFPIVEPIIKQLKIEKVFLSQLHMLPKTKEHELLVHKFPIKENDKEQKLILFINSSNGYLKRLEQKYEAVENRAFFMKKREPFQIYTSVNDLPMFFIEIDYLPQAS